MFKFLRRHPPKESEGRESQKKELFGFRRVRRFSLFEQPLTDLNYESSGCLHSGLVLLKGVGVIPGVFSDDVHRCISAELVHKHTFECYIKTLLPKSFNFEFI